VHNVCRSGRSLSGLGFARPTVKAGSISTFVPVAAA